jgi:hypothetical protein
MLDRLLVVDYPNYSRSDRTNIRSQYLKASGILAAEEGNGMDKLRSLGIFN